MVAMDEAELDGVAEDILGFCCSCCFAMAAQAPKELQERHLEIKHQCDCIWKLERCVGARTVCHLFLVPRPWAKLSFGDHLDSLTPSPRADYCQIAFGAFGCLRRIYPCRLRP